jgi:uncharacterized protein YndB with AHSA1/START domain
MATVIALPATATAPPVERELAITRVLDAPRRLVFRAWTDPAHLMRWWGAHGCTLTACEVDPRPGGALRFSMRSPDGKDYPNSGIFREVVEPERLVFSWAWEEDGGRGHETLVTVTFADEGGRTRLELHQAVFESVEARDLHETGWGQALDRLATFLVDG